MSPKDTFKNDKDESICYIDYYKEKYKCEINVPAQPMLIHIERLKNDTEKEINLVPELCVMTGLSEEERKKESLMKSLNEVIKPNPQKRLKRCQDLIDLINSNKFTKEFLEDWQLSIESKPMRIEGSQINPGNLLLQNERKIPLSKANNLNQDAQGSMFYFRPLNNIVVFYEKKNSQEMDKFCHMLKVVLDHYNWKYKNLQTIPIDSLKNERDIHNAAKQNLNNQVSVCFWILWGSKKNGINYDKIKRIMVNELPVPSQMILTSTIQKPKGF